MRQLGLQSTAQSTQCAQDFAVDHIRFSVCVLGHSAKTYAKSWKCPCSKKNRDHHKPQTSNFQLELFELETGPWISTYNEIT